MRRFALLFLVPASALGQLLSPGELTRSHAHLEGMANCSKCHGGGERISQERCNACHTAIGERIARKAGLHGRLEAAERNCEACHHDHQGKSTPIVEWGSGGLNGFAHKRTGYALVGKHAKVACEGCHDPRRVVASDAKKLVEKKAVTWLGLPTACTSCHFDEHRGQFAAGCETCHDTTTFKIKNFNHDKTAYPLQGKHRPVACGKCHVDKRDDATPAQAFPPPKRGDAFAWYRPVAHSQCSDCHEDIHRGRLGPACDRCHGVTSWTAVTTTDQSNTERSFHQKTRFPLQGAHIAVGCSACHGPWPGQKVAQFRNMTFAHCTNCHADSHVGQLTPGDCDRCHTVASFTPANFSKQDHDRTAYPLQGGHQAVACDLCHVADPRLADRFPEATRADLRRRKRPARVSLARLALPDTKGPCLGCHTDVHAGQFAKRVSTEGCEACHQVSSFADIRFDHEKDSRFRLEGAHAHAECGACHAPVLLADGGSVVEYRPMRMDCAACHADVHQKQFADQLGGDCAACHNVQKFIPSSFRHDNPQLTSFALEGAHAKVACSGCHPAVVLEGVSITRYRPVPRRCEGCHADFHHGAFANLAPSKRLEPGCAQCHAAAQWIPATFDHDSTGYRLRGVHQRSACKSCHLADLSSPIPTSCVGCHRDPHQSVMGSQCLQCHDESSWRSRFGPEQHAQTGFPLAGRHAVIPCVECHAEMSDQTFSRAPRACVACHQSDYSRTGAIVGTIDHLTAGFGTDCQRCHLPFAFAPARLPGHDACFTVSSGAHASIRCLGCHTSVAAPRITGACNTNTAACTSCHSHAQSRTDPIHVNVLGYVYKDRKCYDCHGSLTH